MLFSRRAGLCAGLALFVLGHRQAAAHDITAANLLIRQPWTRATPGGAQVAGGYLTVVNRGTVLERLIGGSLVAADSFGLHEMTNEGGVMKMRPTGPLDIPPGASITLAPSGRHIMFTGLKRGLKKGESVDGTLVFEHAGTVPVQFAVEGFGAKAPGESEASGHTGHSMPGMDIV